jgi:hypothetical protein
MISKTSSKADAMMIARTRFRTKRPHLLEGRLLKTHSINLQICGMNHNSRKKIAVMTGMIGRELARLYNRAQIAMIATKTLAIRKPGWSSLPLGLSVSFACELSGGMRIPLLFRVFSYMSLLMQKLPQSCTISGFESIVSITAVSISPA